ncbi:hypothetical protein [Hydrogenophaga sp.]|uniref:hypothetical protein n=1 Tax=Hydrogenophaga sp. TaxID=1904254 RepID=UPI003D095D6E
MSQSGQRKAADGHPKLYAWHAPEVDCIGKGKARTPYEFGVKAGTAIALRGNLIVGARAFHGNPYDGHTLAEQLEQATILMQDPTSRPATAFVDLSYRGKAKRISEQERKLLKRRQAIEPIIRHLKSDHRMGHCHLKGEQGDRVHAVPCTAGYNVRWLLLMVAKRGINFLAVTFLCLLQARSHGQSLLPCLASVMAKPFRTAMSWMSARNTPDIRRCTGVDLRPLLEFE